MSFLPYVFNCGSLKRVDLEHEHQQAGHRAVEVLWDVEDSSTDLLEERRYVLIIEGQSATQQCIQNHPTAPDIHLRTCIQSAGDHTVGIKNVA